MKKSAWFVRFAPRASAAARVVCCPFAGGGASWYADWSRALDPSLELVAVQLPGRENRIAEAPCESMGAIIAGLLQEAPPLLDKPYMIYGHSMGASIGFELVRALLDRGLPAPVHFVASGSPAPHLPRRRPPISHLPDDDFLREVSRYGGIPEQVISHCELLELFLPMLRADFKVVEEYRTGVHRCHMPVPTSIHGGTDDSMVRPADLLAWKNVADVVNLQMHSGDHFFIKPHYAHILKDIASIARTHRASAGV